ncbi:hypothetical protein BKA57DRAFT_477952 [Linnemannia elongata]|nr:hypothetical protein BKA57DRAFT_477952 [Linnemannia elongata]
MLIRRLMMSMLSLASSSLLLLLPKRRTGIGLQERQQGVIWSGGGRKVAAMPMITMPSDFISVMVIACYCGG